MKIKNYIVKFAKKHGQISSADVHNLKNISRSSLAKYFRELVQDGQLIKSGTTRNALYFPVTNSQKRKNKLSPSRLEQIFKIRNLAEDRVYQEVDQKLRLKNQLSKQAYNIFGFAFNEMVNNAIEHSRSPAVVVRISYDGVRLHFDVIDRGIGAFENVRKTFGLQDHFEAVELLMKGKQTTAKDNHSGQGIFFTSKIADVFTLQSSRLKLTVDQEQDEIYLEDTKKILGTRVGFTIKQRTRKDIKAIFDQFSNDEYEFDKTLVTVHLSKKDGAYLSRSEARRIVIGLEQFHRVIFDFKHVTGIGQGFADEIFRVFQKNHPGMIFEYINASPSVEHMVLWAKKTT